VATACLLGLPADRLLYGGVLEQTFWGLVVDRAVVLSNLRRDNLARAIANELGRRGRA
jgi:hypothetical protein